jgi:hypothetical protein
MLALVITVFTITLGIPAYAENISTTDLSWPLPVTGDQVGFTSVEDYSNAWQSFSRIFVFDGTEKLCAGMNDPYCLARSKPYGLQLLQVLPPCNSTEVKSDCIEGLSLSDGTTTKEATLLKMLPYDHFDADPLKGVPQGGAPSLWTNPFSADAGSGLIVTTSGYMTSHNGHYTFNNFASSVKSYSTKIGNFQPTKIVPMSSVALDGSTGYLSYIGPQYGCIWTDTGLCGVQTSYPGIKSITLRIRITNTQTGWLAGRLVNPVIKVQQITSSQNLISVTAEPAKVAVVSSHAPNSEATSAMRQFMNQGDEFRSFKINEISKLLDAFKSVTADKASKIIPMWSITNGYGQSTNSCLKSSTSFVGLVTTNSVAYQTDPPIFTNGALSYSLASPHFQPNGQPFEGTYDLLLSSTAARCLYRFTNAPISASVSITSEDGSHQVTSSTLQESDGWLRLDVSGFHFSKPSVEVMLKQEKPTTAQSVTPLVGSSMAPPMPKNNSITCVKGKTMKVITNIKPLCPTGWVKKSS